ncbi:hypothetical protein [Pseudomonas paraglycinae]|uniref:hypothetical protein n=1 Tax=Pseudomonas paraglycinae TaxID=2892330 RepID=UPI001F1ACECA|nr:hypothetical protein [Pseudomonas paraglycinae]
MEMDQEFLELHDLDWFASSLDGTVLHFATGGRGFVPDFVRQSISAYEEVYDYILTMSAGCGVEIVEKNLPGFNSDIERQRYLKSFSEMAGRGVFSYDVFDDGGYRLIAKPAVPLKLSDLPGQVRHCVFQSSMHALSMVLPLDIERKREKREDSH